MKRELLPIAQQKLRRRGFTKQRTLDDDYGEFAYIMRKPSFTSRGFYTVAKQSLYYETASFIEDPTTYRFVSRANDYDGLLLLYADEEDSFYVFEPGYVLEHGEVSEGKSKKATVRWLELPIGRGCRLGDYLLREDAPDAIEESAPTPTTLKRFAHDDIEKNESAYRAMGEADVDDDH